MSPCPRQKPDAEQESAPVNTAASVALEASLGVLSSRGGGHLEASLALEASDKVPQHVTQARKNQGKRKDGSKKAAGAGAHTEVLSACDSLAPCAPASASLPLVSASASAPPPLVSSASLPTTCLSCVFSTNLLFVALTVSPS